MSLGIVSKCFEMFFATFRTRTYPYVPRAWLSIEAEEGMGVTKSRKNHEKSEIFEKKYFFENRFLLILGVYTHHIFSVFADVSSSAKGGEKHLKTLRYDA